MLAKILESIPKGGVKALSISKEACFLWDSKQPTPEPNYRILVFDCASLPPIELLIDHFLQQIACTALSIWPHWFGIDNRINHFVDNRIDRDFEIESYVEDIGHIQPDIPKEWLKNSIEACCKKTPPFSEHYPKTLQAQFLAKAIHPDRLLIVIRLAGMKVTQGRLYGLVRAAEWIASHTNASIALLVERELINHPELSSVNLVSIEMEKSDIKVKSNELIQENKSAIWPIIGIPHPLSPGEQLLAKRLIQDTELSSLFSFNKRVQTVRNNYYMVDLLWSEGRLIVEIDGYQFHSTRSVFFNDRQRDYEFTLSGYRVLRLDHEEVVSDVELSIEKIRDVVRFCREHSLSERLSK